MNKLSKREMYAILFPDRIAINSNKHFTKKTRPQLEAMYLNRYGMELNYE